MNVFVRWFQLGTRSVVTIPGWICDIAHAFLLGQSQLLVAATRPCEGLIVPYNALYRIESQQYSKIEVSLLIKDIDRSS